MTTHSGIDGPAAGLTGRLAERAVLDRFVAGVRAGEGRALVMRGEPGVGKTALLDYLTGRAQGCLVARAAGVQSEMELAFAGLLSETAGERPLVCVVDDQQWLDHASAQVLGFAARRLAADPVGLVFAARVPGKDVAGLPELVVQGLSEDDARELLASMLTGPLDVRVR